MRVTISLWVASLGICLVACAKPPPPEHPSSAGLVLHLDARSPVKVLPARFQQVLFVRLDESEENPALGTSIFYSNYSNDGTSTSSIRRPAAAWPSLRSPPCSRLPDPGHARNPAST
jgi:hypothetical protein